tara:strand:- start:266 stop:979 length:714 start_codon:yes stop_codon:yes gene_type:complete
MTEPIRTIRPLTHPTIKYANFLTHMLTDKYNDWGCHIEDTTDWRRDNHKWINLDKMIGFKTIIEDFKEEVIDALPTLWNEEQLDENDLFYGENELEDREENNDYNYIGLINIKCLRGYMLNWEVEEDTLNETLKGEDPIQLIKDMRIILSAEVRSNWSDLFRYEFMDCVSKPFNRYLFILGQLICDEIEDRQTEYIIKLQKDKARFIADKYLEAKYSPYTKLGKDRFNKERKALFQE